MGKLKSIFLIRIWRWEQERVWFGAADKLPKRPSGAEERRSLGNPVWLWLVTSHLRSLAATKHHTVVSILLVWHHCIVQPRWENGKGADIICKQLGYQWGYAYTDPGTHEEMRGPPVATNINACSGQELNVWACPTYVSRGAKAAELCRDHKVDQGVSCFGECGNKIICFSRYRVSCGI